MTSAKNSKFENFLGEDTPDPPTRFVPSALAIMLSPTPPPPPLQKT